MGIRFDKDTRRATNGPIIFFSDPVSEVSFSEEIRGAINSGLSFYSYRHPGDLMISFGSSEGYIEGLGTPGFVTAFFDPQKPFLTIPYKGCGKNRDEGLRYDFPEDSTSFKEYERELKGIKEILRQHPRGKVVAARVMIKEDTLDLGATFFELSRRYPSSYIFCFGTPVTGCWIGASPELLLQSKAGEFSTVALAGTRPSGTFEGWDPKNIEEQKIVTDYIREVFTRQNLTPIVEETFTKAAGNVEHLCTPVKARIKATEINLEGLLHDLSPTPALCGSPKEMALNTIREFENFDRGCYGGFCGPFHSIDDFHFNVVLRCAAVTEKRYCLYSGGGIINSSVTDDEWNETELKSQTFLSAARIQD